MKTVEEIKIEIIYLEGYIAGQKNSCAPYDEEIERAMYKINILKWVIEDSEDVENDKL